MRSGCLNLGPRAVLDRADFAVHEKDRVALVGHNGCGKSTLLNVLAGQGALDDGEVVRRRGLRLGRVEQFLPEGLRDARLVDAVVDVAEGEPWRAEAELLAMGFSEDQFDIPVAGLSGGQENRLMFARALVQEPELLLLDEPTNHLDLATVLLFEGALKAFGGAFVLVSHDREFLDAVCNRTAFIEEGRVRRFELGFSDAREALAEQNEAAALARENEEREIAQLSASAKRLAQWGKNYDSEKLSRRARNIERRVERLEAAKTHVPKGSPLDLELELGASRARQALALEGVEVSVPGRHLFSIEEVVIRPGERVALLGANGVGKTTLIRRIVDALDAEDAEVRFNPQTTLGYYDQELEEAAGSVSLFDFVRKRVDGVDQTVRGRLIHAGFTYEDQDKRMNALSGGERARVLFAVLSMRGPNFLILDEPTNHIDIDGKEQLEDALLNSGATVLVTSHDRRFLETVAERYLWIREGRLQEVHDLARYYAALGEAAGTTAASSDDDASADLLTRIVELEALLEADRARKPKFQKPANQAAWQAEIDRLYRKLE